MASPPAEDGSRVGRGSAILLAAGLLAVVGHGAWYATVDTSPRPFLPEQAAEAKTAVADAFPNATPPTVRVLLVSEDGGDVLSPDTLTALAGLRNRITSDPQVVPVLASGAPIASVLTPLEPHLEGQPGEWDQAAVAAALANATETAEGRRALAAYLDVDAQLQGAQTRAHATALVVRLAPGAEHAALVGAQHRIAGLAEELTVAGTTVATDAPALRQEAARSALGFWAPAGVLGLAAIALLLVGVPGRRLPAWLVGLAGASGAGLTLGSAIGQATPVSLAFSYAGAGVGTLLAALAAGAPAGPSPGWIWLAPLAPVLALVGWAPAGIASLAAVTLVGAAGPPLAAALAPSAVAFSSRAGEGSWVPSGSRRWLRLGGGALVAVLGVGLLTVGGLPAEAVGGWHGVLPEPTEAGQAAAVLEEHFAGTGPGAQLAIAAWGPVEEPGFLLALDEAGDRLERLTLAASGEEVESVLAVGRDWAHDDRARDSSDRYDPAFARLWANATNEQGVPVRNVSTVFAELNALAPDAVRSHLLRDPDGRGGVALLRQQVAVSDVVPRPTAAVDAALQPLVAASDRVAEGGSALDEARAEQALHAGAVPVLLASLAGATVAGALWWGARRERAGPGALVGSALGLVGVLGLLAAGALGLPLRPGTLLTAPLAAVLALGVGLPAAEQARQEDSRPLEGLAFLVTVAAPLALAVLLALVTVPADGLRAAGLTLGLGALAGVLIVPSLVVVAARAGPRGEPEPEPSDAIPRPAHTSCPVCERGTATAVSRCPACGLWNLREACPTHPDALEARCASCGEVLGAPRFD